MLKGILLTNYSYYSPVSKRSIAEPERMNFKAKAIKNDEIIRSRIKISASTRVKSINRNDSNESSSKDYGVVLNDKMQDNKQSKFKLVRNQGFYSPFMKSENRFASPSQLN